MASVVPPTTRTPMAEAQQILCPSCHKPNLRRAKFCQHCAHDMVLNNDGPRYYITRVIKAGGQGSVFELRIPLEHAIHADRESPPDLSGGEVRELQPGTV